MSLRILLVEDNPGDARLVREMLLGHPELVVEPVDCLAAAHARLQSERVDLVLLDLSLRDSQGLATLTSVAAAFPTLPIIALTGLDDDELALATVHEGAHEYLVKGEVTADGLRRTIRHAIERKRAEQERERTLKWQQGVSVLQHSLLADAPLEDKLRAVTEGIVRLFGVEQCQVWLIRPGDLCDGGCRHAADHAGVCPEQCLHLAASSGGSADAGPTHDGRIPLSHPDVGGGGQGEEQAQPNGRAPHDRQWAAQQGLVASASYPLRIPGGELLGGLTVRVQRPMASAEDAILDGLSCAVALTVRQAMAEDARRALEARLVQSQKLEAIGTLAGGVAHDFNNLITIIAGYSESMLAKMPASHPLHEPLQAISEAGARAASLTAHLLAFSRRAVIAPKILCLNQVIQKTENLLRRMIGEDVRWTTALEPALCRVRVDPGQLDQVLLNLAINARDAMPQGGELHISTANIDLDGRFSRTHPDVPPGPYVMVAVRDTGCGMSPAVQARIFEPFFTTKGVGAGTGLGLAMVHGIVKQSHGHIEVESQPGHGTTFRVFFPVAEEACNGGKPATSGERCGRETILLVEDDQAVRGLIALVLRSRGYTVLTAEDGAQAVRIAEGHQEPIDLLLTDIVMPGINGCQVAEAVRLRFPQGQVLFMTGYTDDAIFRRGLIREQGQFLQKPFTPDTLAEKVRSVLDRHG